jgi:hypothetical protein
LRIYAVADGDPQFWADICTAIQVDDRHADNFLVALCALAVDALQVQLASTYCT